VGRILALDYGKKRTGVAVTDPFQIIASPLETVETSTLQSFLKLYCAKEEVDTIVVGMPTRLDNSETHNTGPVNNFIKLLKEQFPMKAIEVEDEHYTSKMAVEAMIKGGMKKKGRRIKGNVDKISAVLILQSFLEENN